MGALSAGSTNTGSVPRPDLRSDPAGAGQWGQSCPCSPPQLSHGNHSSTSARTENFQCNCEIIQWEFNRSLNSTGRMAQEKQQLMIWYRFTLHRKQPKGFATSGD